MSIMVTAQFDARFSAAVRPSVVCLSHAITRQLDKCMCKKDAERHANGDHVTRFTIQNGGRHYLEVVVQLKLGTKSIDIHKICLAAREYTTR